MRPIPRREAPSRPERATVRVTSKGALALPSPVDGETVGTTRRFPLKGSQQGLDPRRDRFFQRDQPAPIEDGGQAIRSSEVVIVEDQDVRKGADGLGEIRQRTRKAGREVRPQASIPPKISKVISQFTVVDDRSLSWHAGGS